MDAFVADDLVASLLLVHGLHPHDVERRIEDALDSVRPYLGSHGGDVKLLGVDDDVVRLQFAGSCKSCPSSAVTLELAVEDAVRAAAPEIVDDRGGGRRSRSRVPTVIPAESLLSRVHHNDRGARQLASGARTRRPRGREKSAGSGWRTPRCWPAGSVTSCSPTGTAAVAAVTRWPARRCTAGWGRLSATPCCAARSAVRISTSCTRAPVSTETADTSAHLDPVPLLDP